MSRSASGHGVSAARYLRYSSGKWVTAKTLNYGYAAVFSTTLAHPSSLASKWAYPSGAFSSGNGGK
jgi:hypothetical protein